VAVHAVTLIPQTDRRSIIDSYHWTYHSQIMKLIAWAMVHHIHPSLPPGYAMLWENIRRSTNRASYLDQMTPACCPPMSPLLYRKEIRGFSDKSNGANKKVRVDTEFRARIHCCLNNWSSIYSPFSPNLHHILCSIN